MHGWKTPGGRGDTAADDRTLALATPGLTRAKLEALLQFQRSFLSALGLLGEERGSARTPEQLTDAEQRARSPLSPELARELPRLSALAADFCAQRWTLKRLEQKRSTCPSPRTEPERELVSRLESEISRLRTMETFSRRHGQPTLELLLAEEDTLLALHEAIQPLYRGEQSSPASPLPKGERRR